MTDTTKPTDPAEKPAVAPLMDSFSSEQLEALTTSAQPLPAAPAPQPPVQEPAPEPSDADLDKEIAEALGDQAIEDLINASPPPDTAAADKAHTSTADAQATVRHSTHRGRVGYQMTRGRIIGFRGDDVFVELSGDDAKNQGIVSLRQFDCPPEEGAVMDFVVERYDPAEGLMVLSREGAVQQAAWENLDRGSTVEARCTGSNKGGLELVLAGSIKAFMPASQIDLGHTDDLTVYHGQKLQAVVEEVRRKPKQLVLSRRKLLEAERESKREQLVTELAVGQIREGTVSNIKPFGVFVDLGGVDGLVHVSDMSHSHVANPEDFVKVGQKITVKVLKVDLAADRVSLGVKQTMPDPWESVVARLSVGAQVEATVTRVADFGAFVEIEPGVDALLPISELSFRRVAKVSEVVNVGDQIRAAILSIDQDKKRMSVSLKQTRDDPWVGAEHRFAADTKVPGKVVRVVDFGAFVELTDGVEGLVHISELSEKRIGTVNEVLKEGDEREFRVLECSESDRRIKLSLRSESERQSEGPRVDVAREQTEYQKRRGARKRDDNLKGGMGNNAAMGTGLGDLKL